MRTTSRFLRPLLAAMVATCVAISPAFAQTAPSAPPEPKPDFVVSPTGDDAGPGTVEKPFATLARARDAVRAERKKNPDRDYTVYLRGGVYRLANTVVFGLEDSAAPGRSITYTAWPGEKIVISGGSPVEGWQPVPSDTPFVTDAAKGKLWMAKLDGKAPTDINALFDEAGTLPESEKAIQEIDRREDYKKLWIHNKNYFRYNVDTDPVFFQFHAVPGQIRDLSAVPFMELAIFPWRGECHHLLPVKSYDADTGVITTHLPGILPLVGARNAARHHIPSALRNAVEFIDAPGEWAYRPDERAIYLWPRSEKPINVLRGVPTELIRIEGITDFDVEDRPVRGLVFRGLTFSHTDRMNWPKEFKRQAVVNQWELHDAPTAAVRLRGAASCRIDACVFEDLGDTGLRLSKFCQNNEIENSLFQNLGGSGILVMGYDMGEKDVSRGNVIRNNRICHVGLADNNSVGMYLFQTAENVVEHNWIHDISYSGIIMTGRPLWDTIVSGITTFETIRNKKVRAAFRAWTIRSGGSESSANNEEFLPDKDGFILGEHDQSNKDIRFTPEEVAWLRSLNYCSRNRISKNRFQQIGLSDSNAIYMSALGSENQISHNFFLPPGPWALRSDVVFDGMTRICGNVILTPGIAFQPTFDCKDNLLLAMPQLMAPMNKDSLDYSKACFEKNIVLTPQKAPHPWIIVAMDRNAHKSLKLPPEVANLPLASPELFYLATMPIDRNVYFSKQDATPELDGYFAVMRGLGREKESMAVSDPMFVDPERYDYRIKPESPARKLGIEGVDARDTGLTPAFPEGFAKRYRAPIVRDSGRRGTKP